MYLNSMQGNALAANPSSLSSATLVSPSTNAERQSKQVHFIPYRMRILGPRNLKMQLFKDETAEGNSLACIHTVLYFHLTFKHHHSQERRQTLARVLSQLKI